MGDDVELRRVEAARALRVDLAAGVQVQVDAGGVDRPLQRARALGDRADVDREPRVADVRRHRGLMDAGRGEPGGVGQAGGLVFGAVVHRGEQVEMEVHVGHGEQLPFRRIIGARHLQS